MRTLTIAGTLLGLTLVVAACSGLAAAESSGAISRRESSNPSAVASAGPVTVRDRIQLARERTTPRRIMKTVTAAIRAPIKRIGKSRPMPSSCAAVCSSQAGISRNVHRSFTKIIISMVTES